MLFKWFFKNKKQREKKEMVHEMGFQEENHPLQKELNHTLSTIKKKIGNSPDLTVRTFQMGSGSHNRVAAIYLEGLTDKDRVNDFVARSLLHKPLEGESQQSLNKKSLFNIILDRALTVGDVKVQDDWNSMMYAILSGEIVILVNGHTGAITGNIRGGEMRSVSEPENEVNIRGPKDSFVESLGTNASLIRRRLKSPNLWLESMRIGNISQTEVAIMYLKGIAEDPLVEEMRRRLKDIRIDAILESGYIEELIQDETKTPFPTVFSSERPDVVAGNLLEGRIAVLVDGTPHVLIVPTTFAQFFKAAEDYYQRFDFAIFMRIIRYFSFFILLLLPSIYIAMTTYHHEMIPTILVLNLLAQREGVPFPVLFEALIMEVAFEVMREAGTRMPRAVGQAVSIVGAIVLGQAGVEAGIVTAMMVIIVSFTGIASFAVPGFALATSARMIRFPMMMAAATFGFYGVIMGVILLVAHLTSLRSFGIPYMSPFAPFGARHQKDTFWRSPFRTELTRPSFAGRDREEGQKDEESAQKDKNIGRRGLL